MRKLLFLAGLLFSVFNGYSQVCPSITTHPSSAIVCGSGNAVFTVVANGTNLTYQWSMSINNGGAWTDIVGATSATYTIVAPSPALNGNLYRVLVTGECGSPQMSNPAAIYVNSTVTHSGVAANPPSICSSGSTDISGTISGGTTSPDVLIGSSGILNAAIPDGSPAGMNSTIMLPSLSIGSFANLKIRINLTHTWSGDVRVTLTNSCGTTVVFDRLGVPGTTFGNSNDFTGVYVFNPSAASPLPESGAVTPGTYRPSDAAGTGHNWSGLTFPCNAGGAWTLNISDNAGGDLGTLVDWAIYLGGEYSHTLTGPGTIVQNAATGANNSTGNFTVSGLPVGVQNFTLTSFDAVGCSVSTIVPVTVTGSPSITTHPVNSTICENGNTTFSVVDNATTPTYQWQISTNGGTTWTDLANVAPFSNVTTATMSVTNAGLVYSGNLFRVVISLACGDVTSNSASLTVNPLPTVNAGPSGLCAPVTLTANGNADTYSWSPGTGLNTTTGNTVIASPTTTTVYTVTGTITATGCENTASVTVLGTPGTPVVTPSAPVVCAGAIQPLSVAPLSFNSPTGGGVTINSSGNGTPYPSTMNVTGLPTSGVRVKAVRLNSISHTFPADIDIVLQSPTGTNVILMSDAGGGTDIVNANLVFDDAAAGILPATIVSGTYRPTNTAGPDNFPAPGPGSVNNVNPTLSTFNGNLNGTWNLFVVDDLGGDGGSLGNWSIEFEVGTAVWSPITGLFSDAAATIPYVAGTPVSTVYFLQSPATSTSYTYTVTNVVGPCQSGPASVTVTVNPVPTITVGPNNQCGPVQLTASATPAGTTFAWSPATGLSGTTGATVTANPQLNTTYTVTGTAPGTGCTNTATVTVNGRPATPVITPSSINICAGSTTTLSISSSGITTSTSGPINIPAGQPGVSSGMAGPYPSTISVGGLPTSGVRVRSVQINGISHTFPSDIDMLLQAPNGTNVILMSDVGGGTDIVNANLVFDDSAPAILAGVIVSGTYRPTNTAGPDNFPAPGPGSVSNTGPTLNTFTGDLNGNWRLFIVDQFGGDVGTITSWSITFEVSGAVWTPITGLFTNPGATIPYVAGTAAGTVYAKPATTTTYTATSTSASCGSASSTATVTVFQPIAITTQPANQTVCQGNNATYTVASSGNFQSYQWQISTDGGGTWTNIAGANSATYVVVAPTPAMNVNRYRVILTNSCNTVTSNSATLTVNVPTPAVATDLYTRRICLSDTLVGLTGVPVGGSWSGPGVSGFNFVPGATGVGTYTLTYSYTNNFGCIATDTTKVIVSDCGERIRLLSEDGVILFPNPTTGQFNIRMNSTLYNYLGMRIYSMNGRLVKAQEFGSMYYGRTVPVDISHLPAATYLVKIYYDDGIRSSEKGFLIVKTGE